MASAVDDGLGYVRIPIALGPHAVGRFISNACQSQLPQLLLHCVRRAASRAAFTAGNNNETRTPMIVMTTNSSTSVKALRSLFITFVPCPSRVDARDAIADKLLKDI
jgi:hypothetical protein